MSAYPIDYMQRPPLKRSRLSVFFRLLLLIPHMIWTPQHPCRSRPLRSR